MSLPIYNGFRFIILTDCNAQSALLLNCCSPPVYTGKRGTAVLFNAPPLWYWQFANNKGGILKGGL